VIGTRERHIDGGVADARLPQQRRQGDDSPGGSGLRIPRPFPIRQNAWWYECARMVFHHVVVGEVDAAARR
jgi:hypothetical protein